MFEAKHVRASGKCETVVLESLDELRALVGPAVVVIRVADELTLLACEHGGLPNTVASSMASVSVGGDAVLMGHDDWQSLCDDWQSPRGG